MNDWMRRTPGAGLHAAIAALLETIRLAVIQAPPDVHQMLAHCLRALQHTRKDPTRLRGQTERPVGPAHPGS